MITRIPQRTQTDCTICAVAMIMGHPYSYERVLKDSDKYPKILENGKFYGWWEIYLRDEGFLPEWQPFAELFSLPQYGGSVVGLLMFDLPHIRFSHIVAVDELGIIDPADNAPPHVDIEEYILQRRNDGGIFHSEFLTVARPGKANQITHCLQRLTRFARQKP